MLNSTKHDHVFWAPYGASCGVNDGETTRQGWYFWDEAGQLGGGPYETEDLAAEALSRYAMSLDHREHRDILQERADKSGFSKPIPGLSCSQAAPASLCQVCLANKMPCFRGRPNDCGNRICELLTEISDLKNGISRVFELVNHWAIEFDVPQSDKLCCPQALHDLVEAIFIKSSEPDEVVAVPDGEQVLDSSEIDNESDLVESLVCGPGRVWLPGPEEDVSPKPVSMIHLQWSHCMAFPGEPGMLTLDASLAMTQPVVCDPPDACKTHGRCWTHSEWEEDRRSEHRVFVSQECNLGALLGSPLRLMLTEPEAEYLCDEGFIIRPADDATKEARETAVSYDMGGPIEVRA
jgi:hypothetical protein